MSDETRPAEEIRADLALLRGALEDLAGMCSPKGHVDAQTEVRVARTRLAADVEPLLRECAELREERDAARDEARTWHEEAIARSDMARAAEARAEQAEATIAKVDSVLDDIDEDMASRCGDSPCDELCSVVSVAVNKVRAALAAAGPSAPEPESKQWWAGGAPGELASYANEVVHWVNANGGEARYFPGPEMGNAGGEFPRIEIRTKDGRVYAKPGDTVQMTDEWFEHPDLANRNLIHRVRAFRVVSEPSAPETPSDPTNACRGCGIDNPVWFAPNEVWNAVMGDHTGFLCPRCFILRAEASGLRPTAWVIAPEAPASSDEPDPSGRVLTFEQVQSYDNCDCGGLSEHADRIADGTCTASSDEPARCKHAVCSCAMGGQPLCPNYRPGPAASGTPDGGAP